MVVELEVFYVIFSMVHVALVNEESPPYASTIWCQICVTLKQNESSGCKQTPDHILDTCELMQEEFKSFLLLWNISYSSSSRVLEKTSQAYYNSYE